MPEDAVVDVPRAARVGAESEDLHDDREAFLRRRAARRALREPLGDVLWLPFWRRPDVNPALVHLEDVDVAGRELRPPDLHDVAARRGASGAKFRLADSSPTN